MLVSLGRSAGPTDLVGSVRACHTRIRHFSALACRLAAPEDAPAAHVQGAAEEVCRYFVEALPLHVADEEQTLQPLLRGRDPSLDQALDRMAAEHHTHEAPLAELVALCRRLSRRPEDVVALRAPLAAVAEPLRKALEAHLLAEEAVVLPAIERLLDAEEQAQVKEAMAARRRPRP